jgi:hypothetical protein
MQRTRLIVLQIILLLHTVFTFGLAQEKYTIEGKILDGSTNHPVEFANIGVLGTYLGTATDLNGAFQLEIDKMYRDFEVSISAVGYKTRTLKLVELTRSEVIVIKLSPTTYGISEVDVKAQSMVLYGIIKAAANMIDENYPASSYLYKSFYARSLNDDDKKVEAIVNINSQKGYGTRNYLDVFESLSYEVEQVRRNFDHHAIEAGLTSLDEILLFDIVRNRGNILDSACVNEFVLQKQESAFYQGDSVWVISYHHPEPHFASTGMKAVTIYHGVIYVSQKSNAIIRNDVKIKRTGYYAYGHNSFADSDQRMNEVNETELAVTTNYRTGNNGKWILSSIDMEQRLLKDDQLATVIAERLQVLEDGSGKSIGTTRREYYSDMSTDQPFWDKFTLPELLPVESQR